MNSETARDTKKEWMQKVDEPKCRVGWAIIKTVVAKIQFGSSPPYKWCKPILIEFCFILQEVLPKAPLEVPSRVPEKAEVKLKMSWLYPNLTVTWNLTRSRNGTKSWLKDVSLGLTMKLNTNTLTVSSSQMLLCSKSIS